mmetsp:Transcript_43752/g.115710  ORF Transcript_43752/g.115710 Transcript_43752/m.115710 type:complete len:400 (+) Transcript_43752:317-1516(+)
MLQQRAPLADRLARRADRLGDVLEVRATLDDASAHGDLRLADPLARVVVALVRLVGAGGVADLTLQEALVLLVEVLEALPVRPLSVGVHVHLHDTVAHGLVDVGLLRAGAAMEDEVEGLLDAVAELGRHVLLEGVEQVRLQLHVAGLVHAVHVAEGGGDGELLGDGREGVPDKLHVRSGGVQLGVVHAGVVHAVLDAAGDADLHLQDDLHGRHPLQVLRADANVLLVRLLGEVEHVAGEERLPGRLEVLLVEIEHAVEPGQQLLRAVVRVHQHWDAVGRRHGTHVVRAGHGTEDRGLQHTLLVRQALAREEGRAAFGELHHDGAAELLARLKHRVHRARARAVEGGDRELVLLREVQQGPRGVAGDDARLHALHIPERHGSPKVFGPDAPSLKLADTAT